MPPEEATASQRASQHLQICRNPYLNRDADFDTLEAYHNLHRENRLRKTDLGTEEQDRKGKMPMNAGTLPKSGSVDCRVSEFHVSQLG